MPWKNKFKNLKPITDLFDQEYKGDYTGTIYNSFWKCDIEEYIEEKYLDQHDFLFIETWSCREGKNEGWIYKQLETEYFFFSNLDYCYSINYPELRKIWFKLYPNPRLNNDYNVMNYIANTFVNNACNWRVSRTKDKNHSEGYYIPVSWFYLNNLIIEKW